MELAVAILAPPNQYDVLVDTLDSILIYCTDKILTVVDAVGWDRYKDLPIRASKVEGFRHGCRKAPYRNVALALKLTHEAWPEADWICYCEHDTLFTSDRFKKNLKMAEEMDVWLLGNDGHVDYLDIPLVQAMLNKPIQSYYYMLGCLHFYHRKFMEKLDEINFFDRFLTLTSGFGKGYFPLYKGYDVSEHLYPTLCRHFGGNVGVFATWDREISKWHGAYKYFPVRWTPSLDPATEDFEEPSILHPLKEFDHPIRAKHRERRKIWKDLQQKEKQLVLS